MCSFFKARAELTSSDAFEIHSEVAANLDARHSRRLGEERPFDLDTGWRLALFESGCLRFGLGLLFRFLFELTLAFFGGALSGQPGAIRSLRSWTLGVEDWTSGVSVIRHAAWYGSPDQRLSRAENIQRN